MVKNITANKIDLKAFLISVGFSRIFFCIASFFLASIFVVIVSVLGKKELPSDFFSIEDDIAFTRSQIEKLQQSESIPSLRNSWLNAVDVADAFDLEIIAFDAGSEGYTVIPNPHWDAKFTGNVNHVLSAAIMMQEFMPVYYHGFSSNKGIASMSFSLIGQN